MNCHTVVVLLFCEFHKFTWICLTGIWINLFSIVNLKAHDFAVCDCINDLRLGGTRLIRRFVTHPTHDCMVHRRNDALAVPWLVCLSKHTWSLFSLEDMHVLTICFTFKFSIQQKNDQHHLHPLWPCMVLFVCSIELSPHSISYSLPVCILPNDFTYLAFVYNTNDSKWNTRFDAHFWEHDEHVRKNVPNRHYGSCIFPCISFHSTHKRARTFGAQTLNLALNLFSLSQFFFGIEDWKLNHCTQMQSCIQRTKEKKYQITKI